MQRPYRAREGARGGWLRSWQTPAGAATASRRPAAPSPSAWPAGPLALSPRPPVSRPRPRTDTDARGEQLMHRRAGRLVLAALAAATVAAIGVGPPAIAAAPSRVGARAAPHP